MHTFNGKSCTIYHSNSLTSAIVRIEDASGERVAIDMADLLDFVGGLVRDEKIGRLEQQTGREALLGEVPQAPADSNTLRIGGLHLQRSDYSTAIVDDKNGWLRLTLPRDSEREVKLCAMFIADWLCTHRPTYVAVDAPALQVRTDRAWFWSRGVNIAGVTYTLRLAP